MVQYKHGLIAYNLIISFPYKINYFKL